MLSLTFSSLATGPRSYYRNSVVINPPQKTQSTTEKLTPITERKMEVNTTPTETAIDVRGPRNSSFSPSHSLSLSFWEFERRRCTR